MTHRVDELFLENKHLTKKLQDCESELKAADIQVKIKEEEKKKELEIMKDFYQKKME
jgi:hypothetical protein